MNVMMKWLFAAITLCSMSFANAQNVHGILRVVKGDVQIKSAKAGGQMVKARIGEQVFPKDVIITGKDARAKIVMVDNNEINVSPESQVEIQKYDYDPAAGKKEVLLNVLYGKVRNKVEQKYDGKTSKFEVKTPSAVAGVRGTDFMTSFDRSNNSSSVVTFHGAVAFGTPGPGGAIMNAVSVTPGKTATSVAGAAPKPPTAMPKSELAKMDNDSNADKAGAPGTKSDRAPGSEKKDGDKKDGASNDKKDSRAPASTGPSGGGSMLEKGVDTVSSVENAPKPPVQPPPPPPQQPTAPVVKPPDVSNIISGGKANLQIHVNSK